MLQKAQNRFNSEKANPIKTAAEAQHDGKIAVSLSI
jgi:hypothetical protein